jgi:hypothetical protein
MALLKNGVRLHGTRVQVTELTLLSKIWRSLRRLAQNSKATNDITWGLPVPNLIQIGLDTWQ